MNILKYICSLAILLGVYSCQNIEDTYDQYDGDGVIRYVGRCTDITTQSHWEGIKINWTNTVDNNLNKIRVNWTYALNGEVVNDSIEVDKSATEYALSNITVSDNVEITLRSVDKNGNLSLPTVVFGRALTPDHEDIIAFPRLLSSSYALNNKVVLIFETWSVRVTDAMISYTQLDGTPKSLELSKEFVEANPIYVLDNVDMNAPITLNRDGYAGGDIMFVNGELGVVNGSFVDLDEVDVSFDPQFNAEFLDILATQFGATTQSQIKEVCSTLTELNIDNSITDLGGIFNFPNLKRVNIGANRYMTKHWSDGQYAIQIHDSQVTLQYLELFKELVPDFELVVHYIHASNLTSFSGATYTNSIPAIPSYDYYTFADGTISTDYDYTPLGQGFVRDSPYLLTDPTPYTDVQMSSTIAKANTITFDMGAVQEVGGFLVKQAQFGYQGAVYSPSAVKLEYSTDGISWNMPVTHLEEIPVYVSSSETTIINLDKPVQARYVRYSYELIQNNNDFGFTLADLLILK